MKPIPTFISGIVVGVLSALIATLLIIIFNIKEAKIVNIDEVPQVPVIEGITNGQNGSIVLHVIENYSFKNNGFKSGFIDKIEVKPVGLKITPQVEIIYIDKNPLRWREEREIKCEYLIKLNRIQHSKLLKKLRDSNETKTSFRTHFYDNSGKNIFSGSLNLYMSTRWFNQNK